MIFFRRCLFPVNLAGLPLVSSILLILAWLSTSASAHEVQPSVADALISGDTLEISVEASVEPFIAGVDLDGLLDTNNSARSDEVDRLRALDPQPLEAAFTDFWPDMASKLSVTVDGAPVPLDLTSFETEEVGNPELPRLSSFRLSGDLPQNDSPVVIGWTADLGTLVLRQTSDAPNAYVGYLQGGTLSDPIPRTGGVDQGFWAALLDYIPVGFDHIVPKGLDHILFVLGLFFLSLNMRPLLWQITAFTAAHTLTLGLASSGIVSVPAEIVEPLIAASIVYVGVENVLSRGMTPWRPVIVLLFGLLHGLGFASVLADFGLGEANFAAKLIGFNVGVELGQLSVIAAAFLVVGLWFGKKPWYKSYIANPASIAIALIGAFWVVERTLL